MILKVFQGITILMIALVIGGTLLWRELFWDGPHDTSRTIIIQQGDTLTDVALTLQQEGVIRRPLLFVRLAQFMEAESDIQAGEFLIPQEKSMIDTLSILQYDQPIQRRVTVPEGTTSEDVIGLLESIPGLKGEVQSLPAEGSLLPETYFYAWGESRNAVLQRMARARDQLLADAWEKRASDLPLDSPEEAVILASIVEKETAQPDERPLIAGVFVNRLRKGIRLQSDPTIVYGITGGKPLGRGLRQSEIDTPTAYNTYSIKGLPPTPIANPGRESILAVLNPTETENLYFVADGTGGHSFAATLDEHNRNVRNWRKIERTRKEDAAKADEG